MADFAPTRPEPTEPSSPLTQSGSLAGKVLFITGASRGIGEAIALRAARDGAKIAVVGKTNEPHPRLRGTVHATCAAIELAGGEALPCVADIRDDQAVTRAVQATVERFGGIDILVNNASAIWLSGTADTPMKRYDLMHAVNVRGTFACSRECLPYLKQAANPHILTLSPPPKLRADWFAPHLAYTLSKYGMSLCTVGLAEELREDGIAANSLWPRTLIATDAIRNILGGEEAMAGTRSPEIVADAAHAIFQRPARECTGNFFMDDEVLAEEGVTDLDQYQYGTGELLPDIFL